MNRILLLLISLAIGFGTKPSLARDLNADELNEVEQAVQSQLRDPESARFDQVQTMDNYIACGLINAKNGFGGYTGFVPFAVATNPDNHSVLYVVGIGSDTNVIETCKRHGFPAYGPITTYRNP